MRSHAVTWMAVVGLVVGLGASPAEDRPIRVAEARAGQPAVVVQFASLDNLIGSARSLAEKVGQEEKARQGEGILKGLLGEKGLQGFDTTKPFGFYGQLTRDVVDSPFALLLPVADEDTVLGLLKQLNIKTEKDKDGIYKVDLPRGEHPAYFRFVNKYVYVTVGRKETLSKDKLLGPEKVFPANKDALTVTLQIDEIPENLRDMAVGQVSLRAATDKNEKRKGETPAQKAFRGAVIDQMLADLKMLVKEGKSLRLGVGADKAGDLTGSLVVTPTPGTNLADAIGRLGKIKSLGGSLGSSNAALNIVLDAVLSDKLRKALEPVIDETIEQARKKADGKEQKELAEALLKALTPTLKMGEFDAGINVRGPGAKGYYTIVTGIKVKDGSALEAAVKELLKKVPQQIHDLVTLDAAKAGGGNIHKVRIENLDEGAKTVFGDNPVYYVGVRENAVLLAVGPDALETIKEVMAAEPKSSPAFQIEASLARLAPLLARDNKHATAAAREAFGKDMKSDKVQVVLEGGDAFRLHGRIMGPVLRFLSLSEEMKKKDQ